MFKILYIDDTENNRILVRDVLSFSEHARAKVAAARCAIS